MALKQQQMQPSNRSNEILVSALNAFYENVCSFIRFIMIKTYGKHGKSMPPIDDLLLLESATALAAMIRTKQVTSTQVVNTFIQRIEQINPLLNCVIDERFKDALEEAAEVDRLLASNQFTVDELKERKPFLGVPMSIKDSIAVKGMIQSCGLWLRKGMRSTEDDETIQLMREAGAIPFVITNVPELCMWWESANKIYGRTLNPYDINRIAGGSSGGEGSLLASAGSPFGIGTDLGGSIRMPAFFNGIFGHKPSPFVILCYGQWPESNGYEELYAFGLGPMCRFACDLKPLLKVLAGENAHMLSLDEPVNLLKLKYFYQNDDCGGLLVSTVDDDVRFGMDNVIQYLANVLNVKPHRVQFNQFKDSINIAMANLIPEKRTLKMDEKLANLNGQINPYVELSKWFFGFSNYTFPGLIKSVLERIGMQYGSATHISYVKECDNLRNEFREMLGETGVFIYPTHPTVAPYHNEPLARVHNMGYTAIFNVLGLPCTAVPLGLGPKEGLPIGIQVVANRNQDRLCLAVACELERAFGGWVAPKSSIISNI